MRYLVAKRVLSDLSGLVSQLRLYCMASVADAENHSYRKPKSTTFSSKPVAAPASTTRVANGSRSPRPFRLRHKTTNNVDSSPSRATEASPLYGLVGRIAELVEAVMSFPFQVRRDHQHTATPAPPSSPTAGGENTKASPPPSHTVSTPDICSPPGVGESGPAIASSAVAASSCEKHLKNGAGSNCVGGGDAGMMCRLVEELNDGSLAASPSCARMVTSAPGTLRVMVALVSLLASMASAGGRT